MSQLKKIEVPDSVEIPYPEDELQDLEICLSYHGFKKLAYKHTGVKPERQEIYLEKKKGQKGQVDKLRAFVRQYKEEVLLQHG